MAAQPDTILRTSRTARLSRVFFAAVVVFGGAIWARSYWVIDSIERLSVTGGPPFRVRGWIVCADSGDLYLQFWTYVGPSCPSRESGLVWEVYREGDGHPIFGRGYRISPDWKLMPNSLEWLGIQLWRWDQQGGPVRARIPFWLLTTLSGVPLLCTAARSLRARRRERTNRCHGCAYDLTANASGVCPECGGPAPAPAPSAPPPA